MPLSFSRSGGNEFLITFEDYCRLCPIRGCHYTKDKPLEVKVECKELTYAREALSYAKMQKLQAKQDASDLTEITAKASSTQVYSKLWNDKVKQNPNRIKCLQSKDVDPLIVGQRAQDWWKEFRKVMAQIDKECKKWA